MYSIFGCLFRWKSKFQRLNIIINNNKKNAAKLWIKRIRKYVTKEATEILVLSLHALVISHLDYCNVILSGIVQGEIKCKEFKICVQKSEKI